MRLKDRTKHESPTPTQELDVQDNLRPDTLFDPDTLLSRLLRYFGDDMEEMLLDE